MPRKVEVWEVDWTKKHLDMLCVRGTWAIPRAGLIFSKTGEKEIALIAAMPFMAEMRNVIMGDGENQIKLTPDTLQGIQKEDFYCIAARARLGGYTVKSNIDFIPEEEQP